MPQPRLLNQTVLALAFGLAMVGTALKANADVVWIKNESRPLLGKITESNDQQIVIQLADRSSRVLARDTIDQVMPTIANERLESLIPGDWETYLELAESMSAQKADPVAHELAIRLFLIVARHGEAESRDSALAGLAHLGRNDQEMNRFLLLQRVYRTRNPLIINPPQPQPVSSSEMERAKTKLLDVVQAIRRGEGSNSIELLQDDEMVHSLPIIAEVCTRQELVQMSRLNRLSLSQLATLLNAELLLRNSRVALQTAPIRDWGVLASQPCRTETELPTLDGVTEFDPVQTVFRDGRWTRPDDQSPDRTR